MSFNWWLIWPLLDLYFSNYVLSFQTRTYMKFWLLHWSYCHSLKCRAENSRNTFLAPILRTKPSLYLKTKLRSLPVGNLLGNTAFFCCLPTSLGVYKFSSLLVVKFTKLQVHKLVSLLAHKLASYHNCTCLQVHKSSLNWLQREEKRRLRHQKWQRHN